jgi:hypothetical protein
MEQTKQYLDMVIMVRLWFHVTNLVSNSGVVATDTTGVGTAQR